MKITRPRREAGPITSGTKSGLSPTKKLGPACDTFTLSKVQDWIFEELETRALNGYEQKLLMRLSERLRALQGHSDGTIVAIRPLENYENTYQKHLNSQT